MKTIKSIKTIIILTVAVFLAFANVMAYTPTTVYYATGTVGEPTEDCHITITDKSCQPIHGSPCTDMTPWGVQQLYENRVPVEGSMRWHCLDPLMEWE